MLTTSVQKNFFRNKRAIESFEEATEKGKYDYWLTQEDIADIARIKYNAFKNSEAAHLYEFEIAGSIVQLMTQIQKFQASTSKKRLTLIINLSNLHWVTLVLTRVNSAYTGYYIDSQGNLLSDAYYELLQRHNVLINDLSLHIGQQTDSYNCGLWALENAIDLHKMLDDEQPIDWLIYQLKRPRNRFYFNTMRRELMEQLRLDPARRERIATDSHDESELLRIRVPDQDSSASKRIKLQAVEKEDVEERLKVFVESIISYAHEKVAVYNLIARGEKISVKALKQEIKTGATGALFGFIISNGLIGTIPSMVASLRTVSYRYYSSKTKAQKITCFFSKEKLMDLSTDLAEAAVEIFRSYEAQFMHITDKAGDKMAIEKLAEDAVIRLMNYIAKQTDVDHLSVKFITKGIICGASDKYFDPKFNRFKLSISGNAIKDEYANTIYTADLYDKVGLVIYDVYSTKFYKKTKLAEFDLYGYREALSWEKTPLNTLIKEYDWIYEEVNPAQIKEGLKHDILSYRPHLHSIATKKKAQTILSNINNQLADTTLIKSPEKKPILFNLRAPVENFIGRTSILRELHQKLSASKTTSIVSAMAGMSLDISSELVPGPAASVSGLGGIGKTQLALRYAQLHAADYDNNVLWIDSETRVSLIQSFFKLADKLKIEKKDKFGEYIDLENIVEAIYEYFSDQKSLFIFDNVENYEEFEVFLPKLSLGNNPHILITSRYRNWQNAAPIISLEVFTENESLALVKQGLSLENDTQNDQIKALHHLLQGLPLALQQATAYIKIQRNSNKDFTIKKYLEIYKAKSKELLDFNFRMHTNDPYLKTAYTTWKVTLDLIREQGLVGETALEVLNIMSFICPENIYTDMLVIPYHPATLGLAMGLLHSYSMLNRGISPAEFVMHRLVQKVVYLHLENNPKQYREIAVKAEAAVMYYAKNMDTRFHYLYFLFNVLEHPELERYLKYKSSVKRISTILMIDNVKMWTTFFEMAYKRFDKFRYIEFLTEAFLNYRRLGAPFYVLSMLTYLKQNMIKGILTLDEVKTIIENKDLLGVDSKIKLSTIPEKREIQLVIASYIKQFEEEIFLESASICLSDRKKRNVKSSCLLKKQRLKENKHQKTIKHLENVRHMARFASSGLFVKDTLAALIRGDFNNVAINFGLLVSGKVFAGLSNALLVQGETVSALETKFLEEELALENKAALEIFFHDKFILAARKNLLSKTIKMASPFIARGTSLFFAYNLKNDIMKYRSGETGLLTSIVSNGAIVSIEGIEGGIEVAELLEIVTGVSEFSGPIGEAIGVLIWLGVEVYETNKALNLIEKNLALTMAEKFTQGIRLFFGLGPSEYIELKARNNQLLQHAVAFLKTHTEIRRYVFSAAFTQEDLDIKSEFHLNHKFNLTLSDSMPDVNSDMQLFCVSGSPIRHLFFDFSYEREKSNVYLCKKTLGIEYVVNRTGDVTLIALDKGNAKGVVASNAPTIFLVNDGDKEYKGNDWGNSFVLLGNEVTGLLQGGKGIDLLTLDNAYNDSRSVLIDRNSFLCKDTIYDFLRYCNLQNKVLLKDINQIFGRANKKDVIFTSKKMLLVDGKGGENEIYPDEIYVTHESEQGLKIILRGDTVVKYVDANLAPYTVDYIVRAEQGDAQVKFPFIDNIPLRFFFDYCLENLTALSIDNYKIQFDLASTPTIDFKNDFFSLTLLDANARLSNASTLPENAYYFFKDDIQIKVLDNKHIVAKSDSVKTIEEIIHSFVFIAKRLQKSFSIELKHNQTVFIGLEKSEIFNCNCLTECYLVGNGGDNIYVLSPLNTTSFPLPEVTVYDYIDENSVEALDTLDLRLITKKANDECQNRSLFPTIDQTHNDLIIKLNTYHYLLNGQCNPLVASWVLATVRLKNALPTEWFQKLTIFLENDLPKCITYRSNKGWFLTQIPLTVPDDKEVIVITHADINHNTELAILKKSGNFIFLQKDKIDLIITNILDETTASLDFYTIICSRFFALAEMRNKVLAMSFIFLDQTLVLKDYEAQINSALCFNNLFNNTPLLASPQESTVNLTDGPASFMRGKRQVKDEFEPASSSAVNVSPLFKNLVGWVKEQTFLFFSKLTNCAHTSNKYRYQKESVLLNETPLRPAANVIFRKKSRFDSANSNVKIEQAFNHSKLKTKKFYAKNKGFAKNIFFTPASKFSIVKPSCINSDGFDSSKTFLVIKENLAQDKEFASKRFFPQIKTNVDFNETLVFANYLLQTIGRKINSSGSC